MGLVDKFKKLEIKAKETLTNEDMAYCDRCTREAEVVRKQLLEKWEYSKKMYDAENLGYKLTDYGYVSKPSRQDFYSSFDYYKFTHIHEVKAIRNLISGLGNHYVTEIIKYFSSKYNLKIYNGYGNYSELKLRPEKPEDELVTEFDYDKIIEWIKHATGGVDLVEIGNTNFKESFRGYFKSWGTYNWEISGGTTIKVNKMVYVNSRYSGIDIDYSKRSEIQDGFNFFETKNLQNSYGIDRSLTELNGSILDPIQFGNLEKIKSIKFYKNGRADIKFRDSKTLNDFLDFYELRKDLEND